MYLIPKSNLYGINEQEKAYHWNVIEKLITETKLNNSYYKIKINTN